jgi:tyrosyl-DNA phosphodiesterase-1
MTQAVWRSPMLPLCSLKTASEPPSAQNTATCQIGSGERFKIDLLRYFKAYGNRLANMTRQLKDYDFSSVRAAFIGSTPSRQKPAAAKPCEQTSFGWLGLQEVLSNVPIATNSDPTTSPPHIVMQVSSIATLGAAPTWLTQFQSALACSTSVQSPASKPAVKPMSASKFGTKDNAFNTQQDKAPHPTFNIIFPTPDEIRTSLDGYESGGSIHTKLQSQQQQKQLEYLHPLFCHWKGLSAASHSSSQAQQQRQALRGPAAPHIKTYIRFSNLEHKTIDWAMVTSANLSKQAWGDVINKKDEIWIQSWEAGVVVWPALFTEPGSVKKTVLVPMFGKDMPGPEDIPETKKITDEMGKVDDTQVVDEIIVGLRMPYDLPLRSYATKEKPWCATMQYSEPDWKGLVWGGY